MAEPIVVLPGGGDLLDLGNFEASVLARGEQTEQAYSLLETRREPPGFGPPMHVHHDAAESFYVLEGEYLMFVGENEYRCPQGSYVYIPKLTPHTFKVVSGAPGKKLVFFAPGAMVGFFEQLADAEAKGEVTPAMLGAISEANSMEVVGPVPDTYL